MNLKEIMDEINKNIDEDLDPSAAKSWINRCMDDLMTIANVQTITTIPIVSGQTLYDLPPNVIEVVQVVKDGNLIRNLALSDLQSSGYKVLNNNKTLLLQPSPDDGTMDVYYKATLPYLYEDEDIPQIPIFFHDLFVLYTMEKFKLQDQEYEDRTISDQLYQLRRTEFQRYVNKTITPPQIMDIWGVDW